MSISFNEIPKNIRVPFVYVEFDNSRAMQGAALMPYTALVVGQKTSAGTKSALELTRVTNAEDAKTWFGPGSMLAQMCEAFLLNNTFTEMIAAPLDDDGAANAASGSVAFSGTATAAGLISLYVGGRRVRAAVAVGDDGEAAAAAAEAAVNAETDLAVTAAASTGTLTLTAKNKGLAGNDIDIRLNYYDDEALPAGLSASITAMSGGAGNPDLADLIAAMGDDWYHLIALPYTDAASLSAMEAELADRWGPMRMIEGSAFSAAAGTHSELGTLGDSRNSPHLTIMNAAGSPSPPWAWAAAVTAVAAYYGNIDPARPFQTLPLSGVLPPAEADRFTLQENNLLLYDGIATHYVDAGGVVRIQRLITTYKTNAQGAEDISYLDVNTPLTLGYLRYDFRNYILRKYPRHKLASDGTRYGAGQAVITPKIGKAEAIARFRLWEEMGLVEGIDQFKNDLICERNISDPNRLDWRLPPDLVNQFRIGGVQVQFLL